MRLEMCGLRRPFYGYRRITAQLRADGYNVNRKRVARLMREGGIQAIFPGPNTSRRNQLHKVHQYLLRDLKITHANHANQAWMIDIPIINENAAPAQGASTMYPALGK